MILKVTDIDGAYIEFPYDVRKEFGKGRVKVFATFDGEPYEGSLVSDFIIYDTEEAGGSIKTKEIYRQDFSEIKPWKVDACNLDNDGETDIFIGVYKDTVFYKDVRNRPLFQYP